MRHSRISTAIAVGVLAVVMLIPGVGAAAAGPAVRAEMGTPVIDVDARTWTFTPRLYDADGVDVGFALFNPNFLSVPPGTYMYTTMATSPPTQVFGLSTGADIATTYLLSVDFFPHPWPIATMAILSASFDLNGAPGAAPAVQRDGAFVWGTVVTLADAGASLPSPTWSGYRFDGWNTAADGSGLAVTESTDLAASPSVALFAQWIPMLGLAAPGTSTAGESAAVTLAGPGDLSAAVLSTDDPAAIVDQTTRTIEFRTAGTWTVSATLDGYDASTALAVVDVAAAALEAIAVVPSAAAVDEGGTLTFAATGTDRFGNPVSIDPTAVRLTSDVTTDVVQGSSVRFVRAGVHQITATVGSISSAVTVRVTATALAASGGPPPQVPLGLGAGGMLLIAVGVLAIAHRTAELRAASKLGP